MTTSIIQLLDDVGIDNINVQLLSTAITNITSTRKGKAAKVTFETGAITPSNIMANTGRVGLVVWCSREGWDRATAEMAKRKAK